MTLKNKSALQRAIGILDGIAWVSTDEKLTDSLIPKQYHQGCLLPSALLICF